MLPRRDLPKIVGTIMIPGGKQEEPRRLAGLASLTAEMLNRGTKHRTAREFEAEADRIGADIGARAGTEFFSVSFACLSEHLHPTLELTSDLLLNPAFPQEELERIVPIRLDALKESRAEPTSVLRRIVRRTAYSDKHPYGWRGDEETLPGVTASDLTDFHRAHFQPGGSRMVLCGDLDPDRAVEVMEEFFGAWESGRSVARIRPRSARGGDRGSAPPHRQGEPPGGGRLAEAGAGARLGRPPRPATRAPRAGRRVLQPAQPESPRADGRYLRSLRRSAPTPAPVNPFGLRLAEHQAGSSRDP